MHERLVPVPGKCERLWKVEPARGIAGDINGVQMLIAAIAANMPTSSTGIHVRAFSCSVPYERQNSHVLPSSA